MSEEKTIQPVAIDPQQEAVFKQMIDAGVFFGKRKSKTHAKMKPYILHSRNGVEIINLQKTQEGADRAMAFLKQKAATGATILVVGTQLTITDAVTALATELHLPFVTKRWLGGTITNFAVIGKRIEYLKKLKRDLAAGAFDKYTKKERVMIEKEMRRLDEFLGGVESLTKIPDVMLVIDPRVHEAAVAEAHHAKIPVIAFTNIDANPESVEYPVVGNTNGLASVGWFLNEVAKVLRVSMINQPAPTAQTSESSAS